MSNVYNAIPSSLRKPVEPSRFVQTLAARAQRPLLIPNGLAHTMALSKSRFARLPQEPEDARLTGVTRSLQRRLLALNLKGSFLQKDTLLGAKIA